RDARAEPRLRFERDGAAVKLDQSFDDRKAEAGAAVPRSVAAAFEALEHSPQLVLGNADALVLDREHHHAAVAPATDADDVTRLGEADRVRQEVIEDLPHARLVRD